MTASDPRNPPVATYLRHAPNPGQTVPRSESESHFLAPDRPTFAQLDDGPDAVFSPALGAARMG